MLGATSVWSSLQPIQTAYTGLPRRFGYLRNWPWVSHGIFNFHYLLETYISKEQRGRRQDGLIKGAQNAKHCPNLDTYVMIWKRRLKGVSGWTALRERQNTRLLLYSSLFSSSFLVSLRQGGRGFHGFLWVGNLVCMKKPKINCIILSELHSYHPMAFPQPTLFDILAYTPGG